MVIDPNEWFALMYEAKRRNELSVSKETQRFVSTADRDGRDRDSSR